MLRQAIKRLIPMAVRPLFRRSAPSSVTDWPLTGEEHAELVRRMDAGDYNFNAATVQKLRAAWKRDNGRVPYPTALMRAYESLDAIAMNEKSLMEVSYRLPYSLAYEETQKEKYEAFLDKCEASGLSLRGARVADIGCGFAGLLDVLHQRGVASSLCGVEYAQSAIDFIARERPWIQGVVADIEGHEADFVATVGQDFDVVLCSEVLEHLRHPEVALRNLLQLNPRRGVAVTVPNGRVDTAGQHINFWSPESWCIFVKGVSTRHKVVVDMCVSRGSPGGHDNFAAFLPI